MYGIHTSPSRIDCLSAGIFKPLALAVVLSLTACAGGDIVFEGGSQANATVDENSSGVVWTAQARVTGALDSKGLIFSLSGEDSALFTLNPTTGALSFKTSPDFEAPADADKNNDYRLIITAALKDKTAQQQVSLNINNVTMPLVELIKPKPYENVGTGEPLEVETLVRFYDAESNSAIEGGGVEMNASPLQRSMQDAQMWHGKMNVPQGGVDLSIVGLRPKGGGIQITTSLWNKVNAIKAAGFGSFDGNYVSIFGPNVGTQSTLNLTDRVIKGAPWVWVDRIGFGAGFHPRLPFVYVLILPPTKPEQLDLSGVSALRYPPQQLQEGVDFDNIDYPAGARALAVDDKNNRVILAVDKPAETSSRSVSISAVPINAKGYFAARTPQYMFDLPALPVGATLKHFAVDGVAKTYILAYEHEATAPGKTIIQGYGENGVKRFETQLGQDISNLVVRENAGLIYVAEHSSSARAKIKVIDTKTGVVADLLLANSDIPHGAYSGLGLDQTNSRLYVGDTVSDAIYVLDLSTMQMSELAYTYMPFVFEDSEN